MQLAGYPYLIMSEAEMESIHQGALRILSELGMIIRHAALLRELAERGLPVDVANECIRFPEQYVDEALATIEPYDWEQHIPSISATASIYAGMYHDPRSGQLVPWNEERMRHYFAFARSLPQINNVGMLGCRGLPAHLAHLEPLYERYYCWKFGVSPFGSIQRTDLCPYLLAMYETWATAQQQPVSEFFHAQVYLGSPLHLGYHEAEQLLYFRQRGLRVNIGSSMMSMGASAPVTIAGAVTLNLAEQLALYLLNRVLYGERQLHVGASISIFDMRAMTRPFGCPEIAITNVLTAQLARRYRASFSGHAGLTDAKLPTCEAGVQKTLTAVPTLLAGGSLWMDAGLLSMDEVCSPIQLLLDCELLTALQQFIRPLHINEERIGLATILEVGVGGLFLDCEHTLKYFREEHWYPQIWSRKMLNAWQEDGAKTDVDRAREIVLAQYASQPDEPVSYLADEVDSELQCILTTAAQSLSC